jgi:hypothetical protein
MTPLPTILPLHHSHLFSLRLWLEVVDDPQVEVRGQVQHVLSGETRYFRDWATLVVWLDTMVSTLESNAQPEEDPVISAKEESYP